MQCQGFPFLFRCLEGIHGGAIIGFKLVDQLRRRVVGSKGKRVGNAADVLFGYASQAETVDNISFNPPTAWD